MNRAGQVEELLNEYAKEHSKITIELIKKIVKLSKEEAVEEFKKQVTEY